MSSIQNSTERLIAENRKLRRALEHLIPWAGILAEGPAWATPEAKERNYKACEKAIDDACKCFPEDYNALENIVLSN